MSVYAGDKEFSPSGQELRITISYADNAISFDDLAQVLKDIQYIYRQSAKELTAASKLTNARRRDGMLVIREVKNGSIEIIADPFFQGVVVNLVSTAICAVFIHVMRRINGRRLMDDSKVLDLIDKTVISEQDLSAAASNAVASTVKARKSLSDRKRIIGLRLTIRFKGELYLCTED